MVKDAVMAKKQKYLIYLLALHVPVIELQNRIFLAASLCRNGMKCPLFVYQKTHKFSEP